MPNDRSAGISSAPTGSVKPGAISGSGGKGDGEGPSPGGGEIQARSREEESLSPRSGLSSSFAKASSSGVSAASVRGDTRLRDLRGRIARAREKNAEKVLAEALAERARERLRLQRERGQGFSLGSLEMADPLKMDLATTALTSGGRQGIAKLGLLDGGGAVTGLAASGAPVALGVLAPLLVMGLMQAKASRPVVDPEEKEFLRRLDRVISRVEQQRGTEGVRELVRRPEVSRRLMSAMMRRGSFDKLDERAAHRFIERQTGGEAIEAHNLRSIEKREREEQRRARLLEEDEMRRPRRDQLER